MRHTYYFSRLQFSDIEAILLTALVYGNVDVKTIKIVNKEISDSAALNFLKQTKQLKL